MPASTTNNEVVLGVDTHLDTHVGAVLSEAGKLLGTLTIPISSEGYQHLLAWAMSYGVLRRAGIEGTGTYGAGLTRVLRSHGVEVLEINRPDRAARRSQGKSDPTDPLLQSPPSPLDAGLSQSDEVCAALFEQQLLNARPLGPGQTTDLLSRHRVVALLP